MIIILAIAIFIFMYCRTRNAQEQEMRDREMQEQEAAELARRRRIKHFSNSRLLPEIIHFLTEDGLPYAISIQQNGIARLQTPPHYLNDGFFSFRNHFIEDIPPADILPLGYAINDALNNRFTVLRNGIHVVTLERPTPALRKF